LFDGPVAEEANKELKLKTIKILKILEIKNINPPLVISS